MSHRAGPARADNDEIVFSLRRLLNDLQNRLTELNDNARRYAALLEELRLRMKRFTQRLLVFRFFCDSQECGFGLQRSGQQSAEIDSGLSRGCAVAANQKLHG